LLDKVAQLCCVSDMGLTVNWMKRSTSAGTRPDNDNGFSTSHRQQSFRLPLNCITQSKEDQHLFGVSKYW